MIATWTVSLLVAETAGSGLRSFAAAVSELMALLTASAAFLIILVRTNRGGLIRWRNILLFAAVPVLILLVFGVLGPSGALHATVEIYVFVMALGGALLVLDAFLQRRRSVLSALGLAFWFATGGGADLRPLTFHFGLTCRPLRSVLRDGFPERPL
jgi:hypothetical protein